MDIASDDAKAARERQFEIDNITRRRSIAAAELKRAQDDATRAAAYLATLDARLAELGAS